MKSKFWACGITIICIVLVVVICIGVIIPSYSYAQTGSMVKQGIIGILTSDEQTEDEEKKYEEELEEKSYL